MTDKPVNLDHHHGMSAQKATDLRRLRAEVEANEQALRLRQEEPEDQLIAAAALDWHGAAEKARYLLNLFAESPGGLDARRPRLMDGERDRLPKELGLPVWRP
jgi:hypothetical protein